MNRNLNAALARATELLTALEREYETCLRTKSISARAEQLTHEVAQLLRSALDRAARCYWDERVSPVLSQEDRSKASIYFPIATSDHELDSTLGRWRWKSVRHEHQELLDFLRLRQPYVSPAFRWLNILDDLATVGKHIDLLPQKVVEDVLVTVSGNDGSVSWGSGVTFGSGVSIMGAPVDPRTQRITPTSGVTERVERWVAFVISKHDVNAIGFSREALSGTGNIISALWTEFGLSK